MNERRDRIWASRSSDGSNVDVSTFFEIDELLSDIHQQYDAALNEWRHAVDTYRDLRFEYLEVKDSTYARLRKTSDKITLVKADVESDPDVRAKERMMEKAHDIREYADRVLKKIETQRSMLQSRAKMIMSQHQYDRTGPD